MKSLSVSQDSSLKKSAEDLHRIETIWYFCTRKQKTLILRKTVRVWCLHKIVRK